MNKTFRIGLLPLCCAFAVWATAGLSARAAPPALGGHGAHHGSNGHNDFNARNGFGSGFGCGFGWGGGLFGFELDGNENRIPYYALHPPVYYSYPVARPYGDSPFASPPAYYGPGGADSGPQTIINPYAVPGSTMPNSKVPSSTAPTSTVPATPTPPSPEKQSPNRAKPTASRTASLSEQPSPSLESLPSPEPAPPTDSTSADSTAATNVHVVLNPYVK